MEYYLVIKKNEILPFAWIDLEVIRPNEISQREKDKYYMILLILKTKINQQTKRKKLIDTENTLMVVRWEGGWSAGWKKGRD